MFLPLFEQIPGIFLAWKSKWQNSKFSRYGGNPDKEGINSFLINETVDDETVQII